MDKEKIINQVISERQSKPHDFRIQAFFACEIEKAILLSTFFNIDATRKTLCDGWINIFAQTIVNESKGIGVPAKELSTLKTELRKIYEEKLVSSKDNTEKYFIARLINYHNEVIKLSSNMSRIDFVAQELLNKSVEKLKFTAEEFLYFTNIYMCSEWVYPQNDIVKILIKIVLRSKLVSGKAAKRTEIIETLLNYNAKRGYHHDIVNFKKILGMITDDDAKILPFLKKYESENGQGCYKMINALFNTPFHQDAWKDLCVKKEIIMIFDAMRSVKNSESFVRKLKSMPDFGADLIESLKRFKSILEKNNLVWYTDKRTGWKDDTVKRFEKAIAVFNDNF